MKCELCRREADTDSGLCTLHERARASLKSGYESWREAYGELAWEAYLSKIIRNDETGEWVAEVARMLLDRGE